MVKASKPSHIIPILRSLHWLRINERIEYKLLSLTYKVITTSQPEISAQPYLCSVYMQNLLLIYCYPSSAICIFLITNHQPLPLDMHHLTCGINSLLHSVNLTLLLVHLILCISPHHTMITVTAFALTICHSLSLSFQT